MSERPVERQQRVGPQIFIRRKILVISVFRDRRPSREQRPHRPVVVSASAENRRTIGNNPHSPIRLLVRIRQLLNRRNCRRVAREAQTTSARSSAPLGSSTCLSFLSSANANRFLSAIQKLLFTSGHCFSNSFSQLRCGIRLSREPRQIRKRSQRLSPQSALIKFASPPEAAARLPPTRVPLPEFFGSPRASYVDFKN